MKFSDLLNTIKTTINPPVRSPIPADAPPARNMPNDNPKYSNADIMAIRRYRPQYQGSTADIVKLIHKYGRDAIMGEIDKQHPKKQPEAPKGFGEVLAAQTNMVPATPTPNPAYDQPIPGGTDIAMNFIRSHTPGGAAPEEYYPALQDPEFMQRVKNADSVRQGVANLLLTQGFLESTLGRNSNNIFGTKPGGQVAQFGSPHEALDYQLGPSVLGGGANPNMNILNEADKTPLTFNRILQLYKSYDPPGAYVDTLRKVFVP